MHRTTALAWLVLGAALLLLSVAGCDKTLPPVPGADFTLTPLAPDTNIATPFGTAAPGARTTPGSGGPPHRRRRSARTSTWCSPAIRSV